MLDLGGAVVAARCLKTCGRHDRAFYDISKNNSFLPNLWERREFCPAKEHGVPRQQKKQNLTAIGL
jgi:hypothetical protein